MRSRWLSRCSRSRRCPGCACRWQVCEFATIGMSDARGSSEYRKSWLRRDGGARMRAPILWMAAGAAALTACSVTGGHPLCKDAASAQAYGLKWQEDIAEARHSGKLTVDQVVKAHGEMFENLGLLKQE